MMLRGCCECSCRPALTGSSSHKSPHRTADGVRPHHSLGTHPLCLCFCLTLDVVTSRWRRVSVFGSGRSQLSDSVLCVQLQPGCDSGSASESVTRTRCAMCGPALSPCLLLWTVAMGVYRTQGQVVAPASLKAEVGRPLLLGCNVTTEAGDVVRQVRWLNVHEKVLLAYQPGPPVRVSHQRADVQLTASRADASYITSYITIRRVRPDDEGCYRCIFDVYPRGPLEGGTCVSITGEVRPEGNKTAVSGKPAALSCWYNLPGKVQQVLWRKTAEQGDTATVASFTERGRQKIEERYGGRVRLSPTLGDTRLTILAVRTEDEACYTCEFHTYPDGTRRGTACLIVYVLPKPEVSHVTSSSSGVTEANCTARSRPAAEITWDAGGDNRTLGPPVPSAYEQGDGTTVVTSTLLFPSALLGDLAPTCVVHHPGLEEPLTVSLGARVGPVTVILLSVCGVAAVLLLCLCVYLCKRFVCTND